MEKKNLFIEYLKYKTVAITVILYVVGISASYSFGKDIHLLLTYGNIFMIVILLMIIGYPMKTHRIRKRLLRELEELLIQKEELLKSPIDPEGYSGFELKDKEDEIAWIKTKLSLL